MLFVKSILLGCAFGLLYDALRITRIAVPTAKWVIFIEDVLFFLTCAVVAFFFLMRTIDGQVRFFIFIGAILGIVLYFHSVSILVMGVSEAVIRIIKAALRVFYRWLLFPIWQLFYNIVVLFMRPARFLGSQFKKTVQRCKYSLKVKREVLYNQLRSIASGKAMQKREKKQRTSRANVKERVTK